MHAPRFLETGSVRVMKRAAFQEAKQLSFGASALYELPSERLWELSDPVDLRSRICCFDVERLPTDFRCFPTDSMR